ncbi:MAG: hypothetical protein Q7T33_15185 [Dehalococcoidia bacterium]|nr:hypothetical protein [Dehalococcoidia bacterium]
MPKHKTSRSAPPPPAPVPGRSLRLPALLGAGVIAVLVVVGTLAFVLTAGGSSGPGVKTAVIVDQLSLTAANPDFVSQARATLASAGYQVDYVPGEQVTVDYYRELPNRHYDVLLLRVHAGITTEVSADSGQRLETEYVSLFTGEPYSDTKYSAEQLNRLGKARYTDSSPPLFGIGPEFVQYSMDGDFGGAVVVMMGCDGLKSQRTAEAFLSKGASAFVSWSKPVSAPHTDTATENLLQQFLVNKKPIEQAVKDAAAEVGPDPSTGAELRILTPGS